ncbi:MAG: cell division regulator GpsB [Ruminococcus sp.]|nr:cell division regulator GpsB [Ruminococcus sp.]
MYSERIYLTPQEILDKEFKIDARGYRPQEVDKYLDMIIRDYTEFINIIKRNEKEMKDLADDNAKLKAEIRKLREQLVASEEASSNSSAAVNNVDLLKRISQLEKVVFGKYE